MFLSLSPTNTDTYINVHTRTRSPECTLTHSTERRTLVYRAQSSEAPIPILFINVFCSPVCFTDNSKTPTNTISSNLNVSVLQSHFQLCFSGFSIRGENVQQLPQVKDLSMCARHLWEGVCVHAYIFTRVQLRVSVYSTDKLLDSLYIMTLLAEICFADGSSDY